LVPLLGVPLIERVIRSAVKGGADDFYVVTGYQGEKVANFLKRLSKRLNVAVTIIQNDDWQKENGFSVLKARDVMKEPFLLLMADHLFDPCIIWALQEKSLNKGEVLLAVDTDINNPLVDMEDVTKVCIKDGYILNIGKTIDDFNGFDTGLFLCTPAIFEALERACKIHNDTTLSAINLQNQYKQMDSGLILMMKKLTKKQKKRYWIRYVVKATTARFHIG
ncbi:MAG: NTP transferase domain-containing protein, partial [Deltaproteobacteria bacterium]|nr:NTP transferase domain-containing protein [Deltaproteobacteria bacterium]